MLVYQRVSLPTSSDQWDPEHLTGVTAIAWIAWICWIA
jgi:hypothetical protein